MKNSEKGLVLKSKKSGVLLLLIFAVVGMQALSYFETLKSDKPETIDLSGTAWDSVISQKPTNDANYPFIKTRSANYNSNVQTGLRVNEEKITPTLFKDADFYQFISDSCSNGNSRIVQPVVCPGSLYQ